jgi:hypothetical protein
MSAKSGNKTKPSAKKPAKPAAGELSGSDLQAVTGGLPSTGGGSAAPPVCVSQL